MKEKKIQQRNTRTLQQLFIEQLQRILFAWTDTIKHTLFKSAYVCLLTQGSISEAAALRKHQLKAEEMIHCVPRWRNCIYSSISLPVALQVLYLCSCGSQPVFIISEEVRKYCCWESALLHFFPFSKDFWSVSLSTPFLGEFTSSTINLYSCVSLIEFNGVYSWASGYRITDFGCNILNSDLFTGANSR